MTFPILHKVVSEYCSTHTLEECIKFVESLWIKNVVIILIGVGVGLLIFGIYQYNKYKEKK